ncbi:hypothetical protein [Raineya sp.]
MYNYDFNLNKLIEQYLPIVLRKPKHLAWLRALFVPFGAFKGFFLDFVASRRKEVIQNGQVAKLETLLNDLYDSVQRRIRITDASPSNFFVLSNTNATIISNSEPIIIPDASDFNFSVDFVVKVVGGGQSNRLVLSNANATIISNDTPLVIGNASSTPFVTQIANTVKRYKIAGKTFQIDSI